MAPSRRLAGEACGDGTDPAGSAMGHAMGHKRVEWPMYRSRFSAPSLKDGEEDAEKTDDIHIVRYYPLNFRSPMT